MAATLDGVRVVEVSLGTSVVGAGLASALPAAILRDLGADVVKVRSSRRLTLDAGVEWERSWDRGKQVEEVDEDGAATTVASLAAGADVIFLSGPERLIEQAGIGVRELSQANARLIGVRIRPSYNSYGTAADIEGLVGARAGLFTQIRAHEKGRPAFADLAVGQAGAGFSAAVGALAGLYERASTGVGRWAETSIYDGFAAMLPMIYGRVENHSATTRLLWEQQGPAETICYRCADGNYVQLWFGAKGAYEAFLEHIGDPPSEKGYNDDLMSGAMVERGKRWAAKFATQDRDWWVADLAGNNFRCEPVLRPGEAFLEEHLRAVGLAVDHDDPTGTLTSLGPLATVTPTGDGSGRGGEGSGRLLSGVRILDLSAYLAGPVAPLVLAHLGAEVVKVEPLTGDIHRNMEPMYAAGQRGKKTVALDMKNPAAAGVLERLFRWADVVHHNSRMGLSDRLGYDEAKVRAANPDVVYSFASGFGERGPKALLPTNDQLIQAITGIEAGQAGIGSAPTFLVWGAVDVAGGWLASCGILAGLYHRRRTGTGQRVASSLLGAGMALKAGPFVRDGQVVSGPVLDADQLGYGACYRMYQGADGAWFALAIPDQDAWDGLRGVVGAAASGLPASPPALRVAPGGLQPEEELLQQAFAAKEASAWVAELDAAGVPVSPVAELDRTAFSAAYLDDPVNVQLRRIVSHEWGDRGRVDQPAFPPRVGPDPAPPAPGRISRLGEHTAEVLEAVGLDAAARAQLAAEGAIPAI